MDREKEENSKMGTMNHSSGFEQSDSMFEGFGSKILMRFYRIFYNDFLFHSVPVLLTNSLSLLYRSSFVQTATEIQIVNPEMKAFKNSINVKWR